jgi:hypothetical protein
MPLPAPQQIQPTAPDPDGDPITIVSGLPRSGTSMMMQMIHAGGLACLTDVERRANEDNPRGFLEFDPVKRLRVDASWMPQAQGKAVKIIAPLLPYLPAGFPYRVIFMERGLDQVLASQQAMLERNGRPSTVDQTQMSRIFATQLQETKQLLEDQKIPTLYIAHSAVLADPASSAHRIGIFLNKDLDQAAMLAAVEPKLYRQR